MTSSMVKRSLDRSQQPLSCRAVTDLPGDAPMWDPPSSDVPPPELPALELLDVVTPDAPVPKKKHRWLFALAVVPVALVVILIVALSGGSGSSKNAFSLSAAALNAQEATNVAYEMDMTLAGNKVTA